MTLVKATAILLLSVLAAPAGADSAPVVFDAGDGARIHADLYESEGTRGVVLAPGGRYRRQSWKREAEVLNRAGYHVLALDFRGHGGSSGPGDTDPYSAPLHLDVIAAVDHLRKRGVTWVAVIGGSLGGMAAGDAAIDAAPGTIDAIVFLGATASLRGADVTKMQGSKLFIVAREDRRSGSEARLVHIRADVERVPEPRELVVVEGSAHAQALFSTDQGPRVLDAILEFLSRH